MVNNLKEAKELLERYKSITLEQLEQRYKRYPNCNGKLVMETFTNFGTIYCILCQSVIGVCSNCIYSFRSKRLNFQCMDIIYSEMCNATSAEDLFNALQKRISYLTHIIEWYETLESKN